MKALQCWTLLKYQPLILGGFVAPDNKHWHFLLHLSHVVDLVFAPRFTQGMITYMRSTVEDHLTVCSPLWQSWHSETSPKAPLFGPFAKHYIKMWSPYWHELSSLRAEEFIFQKVSSHCLQFHKHMSNTGIPAPTESFIFPSFWCPLSPFSRCCTTEDVCCLGTYRLMTKVMTYVFSERGDRMLGTELSCCS